MAEDTIVASYEVCHIIPSGQHNWLPATSTKDAPDGHEWEICGGCGLTRTVPMTVVKE